MLAFWVFFEKSLSSLELLENEWQKLAKAKGRSTRSSLSSFSSKKETNIIENLLCVKHSKYVLATSQVLSHIKLIM